MYAIFLKISFVKIYALCREIRFVVIYELLCGEKFIQKLCMWRKNDKYQVCERYGKVEPNLTSGSGSVENIFFEQISRNEHFMKNFVF